MSFNSYDIEYVELDNCLDNLKFGKYHYKYDDIDFMLNYKNNALKTIIIFHAKVNTNDPIPVFHKYNYDEPNINVLSFSDKLLEKYQFLNSTCFMDLPGENYHERYKNIIDFVLKKTATKTNIFYGSCSGSLPALFYGCLFGEIIFCSNAYIYYEDLENFHNKRAGFNKNLFIYPKIEEILLTHKPKHIYLYFNKSDATTYSQNIKFIKYCHNIIPNSVTYKLHESTTQTYCCQTFYFPENESFENVINSII